MFQYWFPRGKSSHLLSHSFQKSASGQPTTATIVAPWRRNMTFPSYQPRYIDIGVNLADPIFRGIYHGTQRHPDDLAAVVARSRDVGCSKLMVTGSDFKSSRDALELAKQFPGTIFTTAGIHPCSSSIFGTKGQDNPDQNHDCDAPASADQNDDQPDVKRTKEIISELSKFVSDAQQLPTSGGLVALGEFGLDYDRLHYCGKAVQLHSFASQLAFASALAPQLPLFLHSRAAHEDFVRLLKDAFGPRLERLERGGVVHSFTGTMEEMKELADLGLYIGINGCSFKSEENCAVVSQVPLDRLMIETDGPWCEVRPSHHGWTYLTHRPLSVAQPGKVELDESVAVEAKPSQIPEAFSAQQHKSRKRGNNNNHNSNKKSDKPRVPERFPSVKKEKWVEGSMVKGRNEPCMIERVAQIVAAIQGVEVQDVCEAAWNNTVKVFGVEKH